ncbi:MAG: hypothetical protein IPM80_24205 [Proteobacteria bacterium]|nr:hypothetical protein [Pseudomonadota bacterium]
MLAGVDRSGVAAIRLQEEQQGVGLRGGDGHPPGVMMEGKLSPISGYDMVVSGGPLVGHGRLGEDIIFPAMAANGARIGTKAA